MPRHDDLGIPGGAVLIRAVHPDWLKNENDTVRLTSATFLDGRQEASCFIATEVGEVEGFCQHILPELSDLLGYAIPALALIAVSNVREAGLWIYRKPEEFKDNPAHVVISPPDEMNPTQYTKRAKSLASIAEKILL